MRRRGGIITDLHLLGAHLRLAALAVLLAVGLGGTAAAVYGASAGNYSGSTNNFASQVTHWLGTSPKFIARDLTMVYFGYNDIKLSLDEDGDDLSKKAMVDYTDLKAGRVLAGFSCDPYPTTVVAAN